MQRFDELPPLEDAQVLEPGEPQSEQRQRRQLAGKGLGAGHTDLGTGVQVGTAVDLAGDGRAHHVDQADGPGASVLSFD